MLQAHSFAREYCAMSARKRLQADSECAQLWLMVMLLCADNDDDDDLSDDCDDDVNDDASRQMFFNRDVWQRRKTISKTERHSLSIEHGMNVI